jgi:carbamoyltransferase
LANAAFLEQPGASRRQSATEFLARILSEELDTKIPADRIVFVPHHFSHAVSAFEPSGYESSLVVTYDGGGDDGHGKVYSVVGGRYEELKSLEEHQSLGQFYLHLIGLLGYRLFDEYKVMGLAPYGNPSRYLRQLRELYDLGKDGDFVIDIEGLVALGPRLPRPRSGHSSSSFDADLAAAIQAAFEEIAFHLIDSFRLRTGHRRLCLAGGVALNCTFNGRLLRRGNFDEVFVQPAAHDGGCALGAAMAVSRVAEPKRRIAPLTALYWGRQCDDDEVVRPLLDSWSKVIRYERVAEIEQRTARLLAKGAVIGWMQGRSEFGPRALGNRSIVADPRPASNKDRINAMVKKREAFRPFAPSVLEEYAPAVFELSPNQRYDHMTFVARTKRRYARVLGATTHVDGTARLQTVQRDANPRYWRLIDEFRKLTNVPVLLNTSFNNNHEPIVETAHDALTCFLTTGLDCLVVGNYLIRKRRRRARFPFDTGVSLALVAHVVPTAERRLIAGQWQTRYVCGSTLFGCVPMPISGQLFEGLLAADGRKTVDEIFGKRPSRALCAELMQLWQARLISLTMSRDVSSS